MALEWQCPLWRQWSSWETTILSFVCKLWHTSYSNESGLMNIIVSPVYSLCHSHQPTTNHILTGCSTALDQGRHTWCHDSVLQVFVQGIQQDLQPCYKLYADLPGHLASISPPSTVPSSLSSSLSRPDIVLISNDCITLLELSVVTNTKQHLLAANSRKEDCYGPLLLNFAIAGISVELVTIKGSCLGHFCHHQ